MATKHNRSRSNTHDYEDQCLNQWKNPKPTLDNTYRRIVPLEFPERGPANPAEIWSNASMTTQPRASIAEAPELPGTFVGDTQMRHFL